MDRVIAYEGELYTIAFARLKDGRSPGADFFDELRVGDKAKLNNLFRLLGDHGRITNPEKFRVLDDKHRLYELKSYQIRMPFAYATEERALVIVTHGFWKKTSASTPKKEIRRAIRIFEEDQQLAKEEKEDKERFTRVVTVQLKKRKGKR